MGGVMSNDRSQRSERGARRRLRALEVVMLVMLAASLLVHVLTLSQLLRVRDTLRGQIQELATSVVAVKGETLRYTLPIDQQVPIDVDIPIQRTLTVPIQNEV